MRCKPGILAIIIGGCEKALGMPVTVGSFKGTLEGSEYNDYWTVHSPPGRMILIEAGKLQSWAYVRDIHLLPIADPEQFKQMHRELEKVVQE